MSVIAGFEYEDLGEGANLQGEKARKILDLNDDLKRLQALVTGVLRYAKVVHLPDTLLGFGEAWVAVALFSDISADDYESAWSANIRFASLKDIKDATRDADRLGYGLEVRDPEEVQAVLEGWGELRSWFSVNAQGHLYRLESPGSNLGVPVSPRRIQQAIVNEQNRQMGS